MGSSPRPPSGRRRCLGAVLRLTCGHYGLLRCLLDWARVATLKRLLGCNVRLHRPASAPSLSLNVAGSLLLDCGLLTLLVRITLVLRGVLAVVAFRLGPVLLSLDTCHHAVGCPSPSVSDDGGLLSRCSMEPWPPAALTPHVAMGERCPCLRRASRRPVLPTTRARGNGGEAH